MVIRTRNFDGKEFRYFGAYFLRSNAEREQRNKSYAWYTRITKEKLGWKKLDRFVLWIRKKSKSERIGTRRF